MPKGASKVRGNLKRSKCLSLEWVASQEKELWQ
jgi:hypothetical protein